MAQFQFVVPPGIQHMERHNAYKFILEILHWSNKKKEKVNFYSSSSKIAQENKMYSWILQKE